MSGLNAVTPAAKYRELASRSRAGLGCILGCDAAHRDAAGVNGSNRMSLMALRLPRMTSNGCLRSSVLALRRSLKECFLADVALRGLKNGAVVLNQMCHLRTSTTGRSGFEQGSHRPLRYDRSTSERQRLKASSVWNREEGSGMTKKTSTVLLSVLLPYPPAKRA